MTEWVNPDDARAREWLGHQPPCRCMHNEDHQAMCGVSVTSLANLIARVRIEAKIEALRDAMNSPVGSEFVVMARMKADYEAQLTALGKEGE